MSMKSTPVTEELFGYLGKLYWEEDEVLRALTRDLIDRGPPIQVSPDAGRLLHLLTCSVGAERVVEVGTLFGYSGIWIARALPEGGRLDTIEVSDAHADAAEHWFAQAGLTARVRVHRGAALDVLPGLVGPYDMAFFDAVKAEYTAYLDHALRMVRPGGLVLADNVLWNGRVVEPAADDPETRGVRAFNERIASDPRLLSTVLPVGDGLSVSIVKR